MSMKKVVGNACGRKISEKCSRLPWSGSTIHQRFFQMTPYFPPVSTSWLLGPTVPAVQLVDVTVNVDAAPELIFRKSDSPAVMSLPYHTNASTCASVEAAPVR